ncbi:MAG: hypothetical protein V3R66_07725 [Rhodospirillales bacterium]
MVAGRENYATRYGPEGKAEVVDMIGQLAERSATSAEILKSRLHPLLDKKDRGLMGEGGRSWGIISPPRQ